MSEILDWSDIAGHEKVIAGLKSMLISDRLPHALLLQGMAGVGKFKLAKVMATAVLCQNEQDRPCGICAECQLTGKGTHPDEFLIMPAGAAIKIDQLRALQYAVSLSPVRGQRRVCIINDAELMTTQAANSLLKLLEEPPAGFLFILVAHDTRPLLPTILSRCCRLALQPLPLALLRQWLQDRGYTQQQAELATRLSGGRPGKALELLLPDGLAARSQAVELLVRLSQGSGAGAMITGGLEQVNSQAAMKILANLLILLRDTLVLNGGYEQRLLFNPDQMTELMALTSCWQEKGLLAAMQKVQETMRAVTGNANARLALEALCFKISDLAEKENRELYADSGRYPV